MLLIILHLLHLPPSQAQEPQCADFADFGYFCVPYYQCDRQNRINIDGASLIDPRVGEPDCESAPSHEKAVTSRCKSLLEVCCLLPNHKDKCKRGPITLTKGTQPLCGKRNDVGLPQTADLKPSVGESEFGEWPHVCILLRKEFVGAQDQLVKVYQCGASLISDAVVLTSGHCVNNTEELVDRLIVRCGDWDSQTELEDLPHQEQDVEAILKHPCLNVDNHHNNFAILFLKSPFRITSHISPVCLPKPGVVLREQNCVSNGWGKDKFGIEGKYSNILKEVVIPLVENRKCEQQLRDNTRLGEYFKLDDSFICAGGQKGIDTCKGDGGSPLVCKHEGGSWVQAGIVSWGIGCGESDVPSVYANVAAVSCWIDKMVKCHFNQNKSIFGFSGKDCPNTSSCTQSNSECPQNTDNPNLDEEIFNK